MTPYTTRAGIQIGLLYQRPMPPITGLDALRLQAALLEPRTSQPAGPAQRVLGAIVRWL